MTEVVTVNSEQYDTYASLEQADLYLQANFFATAWFALTEDQKGQLLITSTRLFDRQCWIGEKTDEAQPLEWPRTGIEDVDETEVPDGIVNGSIEMAFYLLDGSDAVTSNNPGAQKLKSIAAGSVNMQWFNGKSSAELDRFPLPVQELIGEWLCSGQQVSSVTASGTGGVSVTEDDLGFNEGV